MATCTELATQLSGLQKQLATLQSEQDNPDQACKDQDLTGDACVQYIKSLGGRIAAVKTEIAGVQQQQSDRGCVSSQPFMFCNTGDTWTNWAGNISIKPFHHCFTNNVDGLVAIVREAESAGRHVRASGSHWSFSDISITQDYLIETQKLSRTLTNVIPTALTDAAKSRMLYHVEAGITLHELYHRLDEDFGWALPTLGGSGGQTLAGAISTATHGGDFNLPPLADMVQAIHLAGPGGTQYWIERSAAITDPKMLSTVLPDIHPDNIHYDDNWFYSVLVSMGCMGIIYSLVIEARAQFGLSELRARSSWNVVRPLLVDGTLFTHLPPWIQRTQAAGTPFTPRFLQLVINPYKDDQGDHTCMVTFREETALPNAPTGRSDKNFFNFLCEQADVNALVGPLIAIVSAAALLNPLLAPVVSALTALLVLHVTVSELIAKVVDIAAHAQMSSLVRDLTNTVLTSGQPPEADRTDVSYAIMDGYDYSAPPTNCYKVLSQELALDATNNQYLNFIDELFRITEDAVNHGEYIAGLFAIRFSGRSNAYLAMEQYDRMCTIEISPLTDASSSIDLLRRFEDAMIPYGGRAHWGQLQHQCYTSTYPNFPQWLAIHAALTKNGTFHTFDNDFSVRCGLGRTAHSLRQFLQSKGVHSIRALQPSGSISLRALMGP